MTQTSCSVAFGLFALELKADARFSAAAEWSALSSASDLQDGNVNMRPYATYEPDFWLLDGNYKFLSENTDGVHVGLVSAEITDAAGEFTNNPILQIDFSHPQTIDGVSFRFSPFTGDYASELNIVYRNSIMEVIRSERYYPDGVEWSTNEAVSGVKQIVVSFFGTNRPHRYLRVQSVDFGELVWFEQDAVRSATVVEECDPLSGELRANTLDLSLWSDDARFSILDPEGDYADLRERQPLAVYETVDNTRLFIGQYFLSTWENRSEQEIEFSCTDLIGLMGQVSCRGGLWAAPGVAVEELLDDLLTPASIPYELDETLKGAMLIGWIPAGTLREALQQIAFAIGASVDTSRAWSVRITPMLMAATEDATAHITRAQKGAQQSVSLLSRITGVEVTAHSYLAGTQTRELLDETLAAGTHEVLFDRPMHSLSATGATITESGANYAVLTVASEGAVTLEGNEYIDTRKVVSIEAPYVATSLKSIVRVSDATLVHPGNVNAITQRVYDYYQQRYRQKLRLFAPEVAVGQVVTVDTLYHRQIRALIEKMSLDLTRGMIADAEMTGVAV